MGLPESENFDHMFNCFDTIHVCDRSTYTALAERRAVKNDKLTCANGGKCEGDWLVWGLRNVFYVLMFLCFVFYNVFVQSSLIQLPYINKLSCFLITGSLLQRRSVSKRAIKLIEQKNLVCTVSRSRLAWRFRIPWSRGCRRLWSCCTACAGYGSRSLSTRAGTRTYPWSCAPARHRTRSSTQTCSGCCSCSPTSARRPSPSSSTLHSNHHHDTVQCDTIRSS